MNNLPFKHSIFFTICFSFLALALNSGCETTDYEPLIMKKKLQEMQQEITELKAAVKGIDAPEAPTPPAAPESESGADRGGSDVSATGSKLSLIHI